MNRAPEVCVSVVVPTRNRPTKLAQLLESIDSLESHPAEVIVVSDADDGETDQILSSWIEQPHDFDPHVIRQAAGKGPAAARNAGAKSAANEIVAFIDDDCMAHPTWLQSLTSRIDAESRTVGVGGRILPLRDDVISRYYAKYKILEPPDLLEYLVSANCCYLREPMLAVGGFEEDIRKPGGEDVGLGFKLTQRDWKFTFTDEAIVYHDFRSNVPDFMRTFRNYGQGCRLVTRRYAVASSPATGLFSTRGGYGYGSLAPGRILPNDLRWEVSSVFASVRKQNGTGDALAFAGLRVLQRLSYYWGWLDG